MNKSQQLAQTRENWVDTVKVFACILVVLGHFFQSMVKSDILPYTNYYSLFNQTIYYFHVPLFFICSGYLFQKFTSVRAFGEWKNNFLRKFISLVIPYLVFSIATYIMKTVFSDSVNKEGGGFIDTLLLNPTSPYWYLYALIFVFLISITVSRKAEAWGLLVVALIMKVISFIPGHSIYAIKTLLENEIWFAFGILICYFDIPVRLKRIKVFWGVLASVLFVAVSVGVYIYADWSNELAFIMGIFGCVSVLLVAFKTEKSDFLNKIISLLSKYTFPVFLMHTIFAAGFRSVLLKIGISNSVIHIALGLIISFVGPVIVAVVFRKLKYPEFLLYPNKFIRIGVRKNGQEA